MFFQAFRHLLLRSFYEIISHSSLATRNEKNSTIKRVKAHAMHMQVTEVGKGRGNFFLLGLFILS